jgi:tetratricopeptide (TPR) repeat protein
MLPFQPDAVLVYLGHNELYGPDGIGASWLERQWPALTRLKYSVRKLRLYRAVSSIFPASAPSREEAANLMKEVSGGHLIPPGSGDAARVFTDFEGNLRAIIATFTGAGVPVVISEVTSNLMMPPFVSGPAEEADSTLRRLFRSGDDTSVLNIYRTLAGDDTAHAGIHYWAGRAMLRKGDTNGAYHALLRAKDEDLLKFRAPAEINRVIRQVARETGVPCVAADSIFRAESPGAVPGDELFWEHLHPTLQGYSLLANGFVRTAGKALGLPSLLPALVPPDPDSLSVAWLELAYADLSIRHLTGRWPFKDYHRTPAVIADADPVPLNIVQGVYNRRTTWGDGCYQSATYFWSKGDLRRARTTFEAMLEDYPFSFYTNYLMGSLINTAGDRTGSLPYYRRAIASNPGYSPARLELGLLLVNLGDYDAAISLLEGLAAETGPSTDPVTAATAYYGLGASYANKGDLAKALRMLDRALVIAPDYKSAEQLRAQIRAARQQ